MISYISGYKVHSPLEIQQTSCGYIRFPRQHTDSIVSLSSEHEICNGIQPVTQEEAEDLEQSTVRQADCEMWFEARQDRITASEFSKVYKRKKNIDDNFLCKLFGGQKFTSSATSYGKAHEAKAKYEYMNKFHGAHVHDCGLIVNPSYSFLGATPDGKVCWEGETGILEIKCPYSARDYTIREALKLDNFCLAENNGVIELKKGHDYYCQVQGQLLLSGAPFCDFVVYTINDLHTERIIPDQIFQQNMLNKLATFYMLHGMPFLVAQRSCIQTL
jgi:hypothetical protein